MAKSFKEQSKPKKGTVIFDALNLSFRYKHAKATHFVNEYISTVKSITSSYGRNTIITADGLGGSKYRKEIFPEYKANRDYSRQTEDEKAYFKIFIQEYNNCLEALEEKFPVIRFDGVEADDIAAYLVINRKELGLEEPIWLISSDKDWDLLIEEGVNRFSYVTRKETTVYNWDDHYPVPIDKYLTFKCLTGDKGDNIPGVEQVGPARASSLIETYGDIWDIYSALPIDSRYKYIKNLNDFKDQLLTNVELMDLRQFAEEAIGDNKVKL